MLCRGMDRAQLDIAHNNTLAVPERGEIVADWAARSATVRRRHAGHLDLAYGEGSRERLDLFDVEGAPWYSKDPRTGLLLPLWDRLVLRKHPVIICVRHPAEVAASLWLRNGFTTRRARALWAADTAAAVNHAIDHRSQIATLLSQQDIEPPELDGWSYNDAMH